MGNVMTFLGGLAALAVLGFLLFFELSRESMMFAYVISALILLVLGAMLINLRGAIGAAAGRVMGRFGRAGPGDGGPEIPKEEKPEFPVPPGLSRDVSNPMLKEIMERVIEKEAKPERQEPLEEGRQEPEKKKSGLSGPLSKFRGIGKMGELLKIRKGKAEKQVAIAEMDELEEEMEGTGKGEPKAEPKEEPSWGEGKAEPETETLKEEEAPSCQICGSRENLQKHYIMPLEKGGSSGEDNIIMLCGRHKRQAEQGIYSERLLKRMRDI